MKQLSIEASTEIASVALMVGDEIYSENLPSQMTQAQTLLPVIARILANAELSVSQLDAIVFGRGPGSFTGLRIACSMAKGLAYAHDIKLIPVSTLAAIAQEVRILSGNEQQAVLAILDARMQELYWGYFAPQSIETTEFVGAANLVVAEHTSSCILAGIGLDTIPNQPWQQILTIYPKASAMLHLAMTGLIPAISAGDAQPLYIRNNVTQGAKNG